MPGWSPVKRQQAWAMFMFAFDHGHRPSELGAWCIDTVDISAPKFERGTQSVDLRLISVLYPYTVA